MCGILGQIQLQRGATLMAPREQFINALHLLTHRGPDDWGVDFSDRHSFGHRRLSIIDLDSHAKQPMKTADEQFTIIFNGEIYNYRELGADLTGKGLHFTTKSDTEVLLNGIRYYGISFIEKCIGMFAFALYDKNRDTFYLVRDRLGIKPLYYQTINGKITFASEIKSILQLSEEPARLNLEALSSYLSFRYPIGEETYFKSIQTLKPGHFLEVNSSGNIKIREYWNPTPAFAEQEHDRGEAYYLQEVDSLFRSAVKYRMIADVPIGAYLSGGVDSSLVVACMAQEMDTAVKTFTIGFSEEGYNEFHYANIVANKYKTDHHEIILGGDDYIKTMDKLIGFKDGPLSVPNEVPLYEMSRELKKYITVVLSGEGADEIFGGYGRIFRSCYDYERSKGESLASFTTQDRRVFLENFNTKYGVDGFADQLDHFLKIYSYTNYNDKCSLMADDLPWADIENSLKSEFLYWFEQLPDNSYENKMMYAFERVHLPGLLHRVDTTTMATAVEARVPFVDHRLVEYAFTIPLKYKLKWNSDGDFIKSKLLMSDQISEVYDTPKYILKKVSEKYLPQEVIYRKKMGFPVPLNNWFGGQFNDFARDTLLSTKAKNRGIYNCKNIDLWLNNPLMAQNHSFAMKIWMLINVELFMQKYFDNY